MVDRLKSYVRRSVAGLLWTVALVAGLYLVDRLLMGPRRPQGWVEAESLAAVPAEVGPLPVPAFLPNTMAWPPARVIFRTGARPGWWLGLERSGGEVGLWIGSGVDPVPAALGEVRSCVASAVSCPRGWRVLSTSRSARTIFVVSRASTQQSARILAGLKWSGRL